VVNAAGEILAVGHNRREADADPTAHAEIVALREAARRLGQWRVPHTLIVTQEPCPMCAGALVNARVARLVYGCKNPKAGAVETLYAIPTDVRLNHRMEVVGGVLADECAAILKAFFALRR
jgi:tRNA(adenine34) deaminase